MPLKESGEMYLETVYILSNKSSNVRSIDIAAYMGFSKPSVSRAMGVLRDKQLIEFDSSGNITLTNEGLKIAKTIYERHKTLTAVLVSLGVDEITAADDACRIEHYISDETFKAIKKYIKNLEQ
ncbi:MAG: metal-dependent transcriptional regulator [Clostridia bacterium]|nr:metal-dependent transcriptional regulator [Clostridia bacterium]